MPFMALPVDQRAIAPRPATLPRCQAAWWTGVVLCRAWAPLRNPLCQLTAGSGCTGSARRSLGQTWIVLNWAASQPPAASSSPSCFRRHRLAAGFLGYAGPAAGAL